MGDNRPVSKDSRDPTVGPVKSSAIFGSGVLVVWPFNEIGVK
jgi:signal peptidase I